MLSLYAEGTDPWFRITVTNTGGATLTNVQVTDDVYGFIGSAAILLPVNAVDWIIIGTGTWVAGQHVNFVTGTWVKE